MPARNSSSSTARDFGAAVYRLRLSRGWSRSTLARRAGLSETYVRLLERGLNVPTLTVVIELATVLGIEPADLVREVTSGVP